MAKRKAPPVIRRSEKVKVDVGVACSGFQAPAWWNSFAQHMLDAERLGIEIGNILTISTALPDASKNGLVSFNPFHADQKNRAKKTDANRNEISRRFLEGDADYIYFFDDDTVHPPLTLHNLLRQNRPIISGVYFNPAPPYNPIAYIKQEGGFYTPYTGYPRGTLTQVDAIGIGCALIHRTVFEQIMAEHDVFQRADGTLIPVHKSAVYSTEGAPADRPDVYVENGEIRHKVKPLISNLDMSSETVTARHWPFFLMEYGRTEDYTFCEYAANVGLRPWLDTSIECEHLKIKPTVGKDYWGHIKAIEATNIQPEATF